MCLEILLLIFLAIFLQVRSGRAQDDYSVPIKCYFCYGKAVNSTCADPMNVKTNTHLVIHECPHGVCVKWTRYKNHELYIQRTCTAEMDIKLMMIDGVCRTESRGNGELCMCGKNLCNSARSQTTNTFPLTLSVPIFHLLIYNQVVLPWLR
ncbi:hypothetical protein ScPMuIL_012570 [Solemya velum]